MIAMTDIAVSAGCSTEELRVWIERRWVLPARDSEGAYMFSEADIARVRLIAELKGDLAIDDEAIEVVLPLLDQVYGLRRQLKAVLAAVADLPEEQREKVWRQIRQLPDTTDGVRGTRDAGY
jgi:chaperone modulatory protein CbpM